MAVPECSCGLWICPECRPEFHERMARAAQEADEEMRQLLTPEAYARLRAAEAVEDARVVGGDDLAAEVAAEREQDHEDDRRLHGDGWR